MSGTFLENFSYLNNGNNLARLDIHSVIDAIQIAITKKTLRKLSLIMNRIFKKEAF